MSAPFAEATDVAARWRPLTDEETARAAVLAGDASSLIRAEFPDVDGQIAAGNLDPNVLTIVVSNMVKRAMIAPTDGITQQSETVGPYSQAQTYANPLGNVFLTAAERTLILGYKPSAGSFRYNNSTRLLGSGDLGAVYDGGVTILP